MQKKIIWQVALIVTAIFLIIITSSSYKSLKRMRFEFNEKKAVLIRENLELKDRLNSIQEMVSQKMASLDILEEEKKNVEKEIAVLKQGNDELMDGSRRKLEDIKRNNAIMKKKIANLESNPVVQSIKEALAREPNNDVKKLVENALNRIELIKSGKSVALEPIVVTEKSYEPSGDGTESTVKQALKGTVLSVDRKNNLVVINLGAREGAREDDRITILKDEKEIAQAQIVSVRYELSAAMVDNPKTAYTMNDIKEGQVVLIMKK